MKQSFSRRSLLAGAGAATLLSATGNTQAADAGWQDGAPAEWERVLAAARAEGQVTVAGFPLLQEKIKHYWKH